MPAVNVVLAPSGIADGVRAVLTDLSAAGLVEPFVWITDPSDTTPPATVTLVERGRAADATMQQIVTAQRIDLLRICVIVPLLGSDVPLRIEQERYLSDLFEAFAGGAKSVRVRALLARPGMDPPPGVRLAVDGWHNVLVAPEDGKGPGGGFGWIRLSASTSAADLGRHAAPVLAGVLGLWTDLDHAPLDDEEILPGAVVRLARSYYRRLETGQAEGDLRRQLLSQGGRLPLPSTQQGQVVLVDDATRATNAMAQQLWRKYAWVLKGSRSEYEPEEATQQVGALGALKRFFSFIWAALKNAPSAWFRKMVDSVSSGIAGSINRTVFGGNESAYEVVFNGRTARGKQARWADIGSASSQLSGLIANTGDGGSGNARVDLSELWRDYSHAALSLADAGGRTGELPPARVGVNLAIVPAAADIVPGPPQRFSDIPGVIAASVEVDGVDATDRLGIDYLKHNLKEVERGRPDQGMKASETLTKLDEWQRKHDQSFGVLVGRSIADAFSAVYSEARELIAKLIVPLDPPPEPDDSNKKLVRWIQVAFGVGLLVSLGLGYATKIGRLAWWLALTIALVVFLISLLLVVNSYINTQRELFHLLHKKKTAESRRITDEKRLREALRDLNRIAQAYGEYLAWSRALGAFLMAPLGPDVFRQQDLLRVSWGLPLSTSIGYASPTDGDIGTTVGDLRHTLFTVGWLSDAWEELIRRAAPPPPGSRDVGVDRSPLWGQPGAGSGSALDGWSTALFSGAVTSTGADVTWQKALTKLSGSMSKQLDTLVSQVQEPGGAKVATATFLSQVDEPATASDRNTFDSALLSDIAVVNGANTVAADIRKKRQNGVGMTCAITQLSHAVTVDYLKLQSVAPPNTLSHRGQSTTDGGSADTRSETDGDNRPPEIGGGFKF